MDFSLSSLGSLGFGGGGGGGGAPVSSKATAYNTFGGSSNQSVLLSLGTLFLLGLFAVLLLKK